MYNFFALFLNEPSTTKIYTYSLTLSLHHALPICQHCDCPLTDVNQPALVKWRSLSGSISTPIPGPEGNRISKSLISSWVCVSVSANTQGPSSSHPKGIVGNVAYTWRAAAVPIDESNMVPP